MTAKRRRRRPKPPHPWSLDEVAACLELYATMTAEDTARELYRIGASPVRRTASAVRHAIATHSASALQIVDLVRDYGGLPLTYRDLEEELGMSRKRVQALTLPLVRAGVLERIEGDYGQALLRDPIAWREAAA